MKSLFGGDRSKWSECADVYLSRNASGFYTRLCVGVFFWLFFSTSALGILLFMKASINNHTNTLD